MRRAAWADPTVQAEFAAWAGRLRGAGVELTPAQLERELWDVARRWVGLRARLTAPFHPYARAVAGTQPWRMFVAPHLYPAPLHLEILRDGRWEPVYVARSPTRRWRARLLDHDRMRAAIFRYGWPSYERPYRQLVAWLALRAAEDFPRARAFRARMYKRRTPSPAQVRAGVRPPGRFVHERTVPLAPSRRRGASTRGAAEGAP